MGVVYHAHYLVWCEIGRTDFIRRLGTSYAELEEQGTRLAVVEASLRYAAAARYDQRIRVVTRLDRVQSRTLAFTYEILAEPEPGAEALRLATATTRLIALGHDGRPRALPADLLTRLRTAAPD